MSGIPITGMKLLPGLESTQSIQRPPLEQLTAEIPGTQKEDFTSFLNKFVESVDELGNVAEDAGNAFLNGEDIDLHEVMIAGEESGIAFDLLLEIRNKLLDAYKNLIRMPL